MLDTCVCYDMPCSEDDPKPVSIDFKFKTPKTLLVSGPHDTLEAQAVSAVATA